VGDKFMHSVHVFVQSPALGVALGQTHCCETLQVWLLAVQPMLYRPVPHGLHVVLLVVFL
jgi:hypothetical protein